MAVSAIRNGLELQSLPRSWVMGTGANHAFASQTGRFRFVETIETDTEPEGPDAEPTADFLDFAMNGDRAVWEWLNLSGAIGLYNFSGFDLRPEHRFGDWYVQKQERVRSVVAGIKSDSTFLRRYLIEMNLTDMIDDVNETFSRPGERDQYFRGPDDGYRFVDLVPSLNVRIALEVTVHHNRHYKFTQHDRADVFALCQTIPYVDAVWSDRHWGHIARMSKVDQKFSTHVVSDPADAMTVLSKLSS